MNPVFLIQGNAAHIPLADESVHCVVTSPPYYGLRMYDAKPVTFGGDPGCEHEWDECRHDPQPHGDDGKTGTALEGGSTTQANTRIGTVVSGFCRRCGARPVPPDLLEMWIARGWLEEVAPPAWNPPEPVPATVFDPFGGTGVVGLVARQLGLRAVCMDLSAPYLRLAEERTSLGPLFDLRIEEIA